MKSITIISLLLVLGLNGFGQSYSLTIDSTIIDVSYSDDWGISAPELIYADGDTLRPYEYNYLNSNQIKMRCYYLIKGLSSKPYGLFEEWYKSGQKKLETFRPKIGNKTKYINMWSEAGNQILKNGEGYYYTMYGNLWSDSIVIEVKDSVLIGSYLKYKRDTLHPFYLYEKTTYNDNVTNGLYKYYYHSGEVKESGTYERNRKHGIVVEYYVNGVTKSNGHYLNSHKNGDWSYWNENGELIVTEFYKKGEVFGEYSEYYSNGKRKVTGSFIHVKGEGKQVQYNEYGDEISSTIIETIKPIRDGYWNYFDKEGNKIKSIFYQGGAKYIYDNLK